MRLRVVLDTNVNISGLLFGGVPGSLVDAGIQKQFSSITSSAILAELTAKFSGKLRRPPHEVARLVTIIRRNSELVEPNESVTVSRDLKTTTFSNARYRAMPT